MNRKIFLPLVAVIIFVMPVFFSSSMMLSPAYAQKNNNSTTSNSGDKVQDGLTDIGGAYPAGARNSNYKVQDIAKKIIDWALYLAAIIAVIFIIIGGFLYITSAGDPGRATKGRQTLVNALIGLAIVVLSYLIVQIVYNFLTQPN